MTVTAIVGGRIVPVDADPVEGGTLLIQDGRISALGGADLPVPQDATVVDAAGKWVLPGFIEAHGHLGVHEEGEGWAGSDVIFRTASSREMTLRSRTYSPSTRTALP